MLVHRSFLSMDFHQGQQDIRPQNSDMCCDDGPHPEGHVVVCPKKRPDMSVEVADGSIRTMHDDSRAKHEVSREIRMSDMDTRV